MIPDSSTVIQAFACFMASASAFLFLALALRRLSARSALRREAAYISSALRDLPAIMAELSRGVESSRRPAQKPAQSFPTAREAEEAA